MIIFLAIFIFAAIRYARQLKNNSLPFTIISIVLSTAMFLSGNVNTPITSGDLGIAFFLAVMFQSAFPKGSRLYNKLLLVRKEYAICGFIFILPHGLLYLYGANQALEWNGIASLAIMIPLFITSFIVIRKKMTPKHWKLLHSLSYPAYALMLAHVIYVGDLPAKIMYSTVALAYLVLKFRYNGFPKLTFKSQKYAISAFVVLLAAVNIFVLASGSTNSGIYDTASYSLETTTLADGIYSGQASGFKGRTVEVDVTISENSLADINIVSYGSTSPHKGVDFEAAVDSVKDDILAAQSTDVDTVSGATKSTSGLINAVNEALASAMEQTIN
jgi:DMSO/TMAO reductase YedYZ heme-binding membrane subunit/uncharacterized protein with FMN-binding domain